MIDYCKIREEDSWFFESMRDFIKNLTDLEPAEWDHIPLRLYGKDNGFYGRKHTDEQKLAWSKMKKGVPQGPKSEEHKEKLRKPKSSKENYKGSPGKITCINKQGRAIQISKDVYNKQKTSGTPIEMWEFVNTNSHEAKRRKTA